MKFIGNFYCNTDYLNFKYKVSIDKTGLFYTKIPINILNKLYNLDVNIMFHDVKKTLISGITLKELQMKVFQIINEYSFNYRLNQYSNFETVGSKIKNFRKKVNLTQTEASKRIGIGLRCLRELEQGKPTIKTDILVKVLNFYGYDVGIIKRNNKNSKFKDVSDFKYTNWTIKLRNIIKERDNYQCKLCRISEEKHKELYNQPLHVHHIDYDKSNSDENNLITLCRKCHRKTNKNRECWIKIFQYITIGSK